VAQYLPEGTTLDYLSFGADVRFMLVEEKSFVPEISIGGGANYLQGAVAKSFVNALQLGNFEVPDPDNPTTSYLYTLDLSDPTVGFEWESTVIDVKAQVSKRLLFFRPYIGAGATYGRSTAGGGFSADVQLSSDDPAAPAINPEEVNPILEEAGMPTIPDLGPQGFGLYSAVDGFAGRAFAGLSIDLFILSTDLTVLYEFTSGTVAASANIRLQF